jgi:adenine phosphoribosyltransferase
MLEASMDLKSYIRDIPDFPKEGIIFKDITPLLQNPRPFCYAIDAIADFLLAKRIDAILSIEARGFLFGAALAYRLQKPLVPIRKKGKLPFNTISVTYSLEYGTDTLEIHKDGVLTGQEVVIVDDVLATGGTVGAACRLVGEIGAKVSGLAFLIELGFLDGRKNLSNYDICSLITY